MKILKKALIAADKAREAEQAVKEDMKEMENHYQDFQQRCFYDALSYGFSLLEAESIGYNVTELTDANLEDIEKLLGVEKALEVLEKGHQFIFEVDIVTINGNHIEKIFTFSKKSLEVAARLVLDEVAEAIKEDAYNLVIDKINLNNRVLKVTHDFHFQDFVRLDSVGLKLEGDELEKLAPFKVLYIEEEDAIMVNNRLRTYSINKSNLIIDPLNNIVDVFLIGTADGLVAKVRTLSFFLKPYHTTAIEYNLLKKVVDTLVEANMQVEVNDIAVDDIDWSQFDKSTIFNATRGKSKKTNQISELEI